MSRSRLCYLPAVEALSLLQAANLSPVEPFGAVIARAEKVEPKAEAFYHTCWERAFRQPANHRIDTFPVVRSRRRA